MKTKTRLTLAIIILSLSSMIQTFSASATLIDVNNPYQDVFVFYPSLKNWNGNIFFGSEENLYGNQQIVDDCNSNQPELCNPIKFFFQLVIRNGENEISLREHEYDRTDAVSYHEEVFKEEFSLNDKKGEITYKVMIQTEQHTDGKGFDFCKIKVLYAELGGQEMKLDEKAWKEIQKNCTIKEALNQNCVMRCPQVEPSEEKSPQKEQDTFKKKSSKKALKKEKKIAKKIEKEIKKAFNKIKDFFDDED